MPQRLKFTGYLPTDSLEPHQLDLADPKLGPLSEDGHLELVVGETGRSLALEDLEDVDVELVDA